MASKDEQSGVFRHSRNYVKYFPLSKGLFEFLSPQNEKKRRRKNPQTTRMITK